jgi:hypothetical protein
MRSFLSLFDGGIASLRAFSTNEQLQLSGGSHVSLLFSRRRSFHASRNRWKSETQEGATSWRATSAVHQLVAFPRVSQLVWATVWGSGGSGKCHSK